MFKLEVWETLLTSMRLGEVAEFWCDAVHTGLYPIVSKGMRLIAQGKDPLEGQRHMCGMGNLFHYHSTGFPELDELMRTPQPLIFIMELLQVGDPMSYHRESWMMEKDEKLSTVPLLHMRGNELVKQRQFQEAASQYKEAVLLLKTIQSREMPGDADYMNLGRMIVPLELNYCQCMLELHEYYEVIEHADELLDKHKDCVKGYYKRAKAHAAVWNEKEARRDFNTVAHLDPTLASLVQRELRALSERIKEKYWQEKDAYWNKLDAATGNEEEKTGDEEEPKTDDGDKTEEAKDWQQMLRLVMLLQEQGNVLMKDKRFQDASAKFKEALDYVDVLQNKVRGDVEDGESLAKVRLPLSLNLSQCMLELQDYQQVVHINDQLLESHQGHFKALYQRARAHAALCNQEEARRDFAAVEKLDPKFKPLVRRELKKLGENLRSMHAHQNKTYRDATRENWGAGRARRSDATPEISGDDVNQSCQPHEEEEEPENENVVSAELMVDNGGGPDEDGRTLTAAVSDSVASGRST
ncbi:sperm-associated antigen 1 isoform X2 [Festucalex cinctus]